MLKEDTRFNGICSTLVLLNGWKSMLKEVGPCFTLRRSVCLNDVLRATPLSLCRTIMYTMDKNPPTLAYPPLPLEDI